MSFRFYLNIIFVLSLVATLGSLYVSTFGDPIANLLSGDLRNPLLGLPACTLCRYTRVMLFPLVLISLVGIIRNDRQVRAITLPFSILWFLISLYTYGLEMKRRVGGEVCGINAAVPCGVAPIAYRGRLTLAFSGIFVFALIFLCCLAMRSLAKGVHSSTAETKTWKTDF